MSGNRPANAILITACVLLAGCGRAHAPVDSQTKNVTNTVVENAGQEPHPGELSRRGLSLQIELKAADGPPTIDLQNPLRMVLTNNSDQPLRISDPENDPSHFQLSFEFKNSTSGATTVARPRVAKGRGFWLARGDSVDHHGDVIEIAPREQLTLEVGLDGFSGNRKTWIGLPTPGWTDQFSLSARFVVNGAVDQSPSVWTGELVSAPVTVRWIARGLKTPHDYLIHGFPDKAIELFTADPMLIEQRDGNQCTPLHHAARFGHPAAVHWLLDHGANVNAVAYNGFTPLLLSDDRDVIATILQYKPDLSIRSGIEGTTPLQHAVAEWSRQREPTEKARWREIVDLYLSQGAEYDLPTAIHLDDLERIKAILKESPGRADRFQNQSPLRLAASLGRLEICRYLIDEFSVDVNDFERGLGYPILKVALAFPEIVKLLIDHGADLKTRITWRGGRSGIWIIDDDATALHYAADDGVPVTITLLIDHGVDIFATAHDIWDPETKQTALEVAAFFGRAENARAIVQHPKFDAADPALRQSVLDRSLRIGAIPSWLAPDAQRPQLVKILLAKGANPIASADSITAMQAAAREIHPDQHKENAEIREIVALLVKSGATMDLFSAVAIGDEVQVRKLLEKDPASANSRGHDGYPALHFAVGMNSPNIVAALLKARVDVNLRNESENQGGLGSTALHTAAFWGRYEIARLLIDAGADVNAKNERQETPLDEAMRMENAKIAKLLREKGAVRGVENNDE